jgi:DNA-binding transcriptional MerR regulator
MAWSTRELAGLAGTTVNTVRHYHRLGLLPLPEREDNGYKQYGVADLVRLLRIRRLADLGVPLAEIGRVSAGGPDATDVLRRIDADLAASMERLARARADIAAILAGGGPADTAAGFESVAAGLSEADRSILHVVGRLWDTDAVGDVQVMAQEDATVNAEVNAALSALGADADETTRQGLAERLAPVLAAYREKFPWLQAPETRLVRDENGARQAYVAALSELYNPAQIDVLRRAVLLLGLDRVPGTGS